MRLILILIIFFPFNVYAETTIGDVTKLPLPRFASLRGDQVFLLPERARPRDIL